MPRGLIWAVACILILGGIFYCTQGTSRETLEPLFGGRTYSDWELDQLEFAFIKSELDGYRRDSEQMLIPREQRREFLSAIESSSTLPYALKSPDSDEYDVGSLFMSESARKSNRQSVKARRLADTIITTFSDVAWASVSYDVRESSGFDNATIQSASVVLVSKERKPLAPSRITMIQSLVCGAYAGMQSDQVTVTDTSARKTYDGSEDPEARRQRHAEYELEQRLTRLLSGYKGLQIVARSIPRNPIGETTTNSEPTLRRPPSTVRSIEHENAKQVFAMHVSVGIPDSQFHTLWMNEYRSMHPDSSVVIAPRAEQLETIKTKVTANIKEAIRPLVAGGNADPNEAIRVWSFPDPSRTIRYASKSESENTQASLVSWVRSNATAVIPVGILLMIAITFSIAATRLRMRATTVDSSTPVKEWPTEAVAEVGESASRLSKTEEATLRDDLAELVETNPELAAQIVHSWMSDAA